MMRPSDQAKLLFLYLLRSSSALATRATTSTTTSSTTTTTTTSTSGAATAAAVSATASPKQVPAFPNPSGLEGHISLRVATRLDVPSIQRCNLASLPENYSSNFYVNHIRSFPDLALVAEHVPPGATSLDQGGSGGAGGPAAKARRNPFESYNPAAPESQIIGYVLGKIEQSNFSPSKVSNSHGHDELDEYYRNLAIQQPKEILGHVTSLAVLKPFRRKGLAALLMKQLHFHMKYGHQATGVGLHVRVSNIAARRLYCEGMGYGVVDVIRGYYADGEDAFFMKKDLSIQNEDEFSSMFMKQQQLQQQQAAKRNPLGSRWPLRRKNENQQLNKSTTYPNVPMEFRLPMIIPLGNYNDSKSEDEKHVAAVAEAGNVPEMVDDSPEEEDARVMTGSL